MVGARGRPGVIIALVEGHKKGGYRKNIVTFRFFTDEKSNVPMLHNPSAEHYLLDKVMMEVADA